MPTPMPTIDATWGVKPGVMNTCDHSTTPDRPMLMPNSAVTIGRPIATTDPNASSRITTAAARPNTSLDGIDPVSKASPAKSVSIPAARSGPARCSIVVSGCADGVVAAASKATEA